LPFNPAPPGKGVEDEKVDDPGDPVGMKDIVDSGKQEQLRGCNVLKMRP